MYFHFRMSRTVVIRNFRLGRKCCIAQEYLQKFTGDNDHAERILQEEHLYKSAILSRKLGEAVLEDFEFRAPEIFRKRRHSCLLDRNHLIEFLTAPERKFGDIYEKPNQEPYSLSQPAPGLACGCRRLKIGRGHGGNLRFPKSCFNW